MSGIGASSSSYMEQDRQSQREWPPRHMDPYTDSEESSDNEETEYDMGEEEEEQEENEVRWERKRKGNMSMEDMLKLESKKGFGDSKQKLQIAKSKSHEFPGKRKMSSAPTHWIESKYAPTEMPLMRKRAPPMKSLDPKRNVKNQIITRDPRFDDLSGNLNIHSWQKKFGFLRDMRMKEIGELQKTLRKTKDRDEAMKIKDIIQRMKNQEQQRQFDNKYQEVVREERTKQMEALKEGKKPMYMAKNKLKIQARAKYYETLTKEKRVDKYMKRQEKRQHAKERKTFEKTEEEMKSTNKYLQKF